MTKKIAARALTAVLVFLAAQPVLVVLHEALILHVGSLLAGYAKMGLALHVARLFVASPVHSQLMVESVGGIQAEGLALNGPAGRLLHQGWPAFFLRSDYVAPGAMASAVVHSGSSVLSVLITRATVEVLFIVLGAILVQIGLRGTTLRELIRRGRMRCRLGTALGLFVEAQAIWALFQLTLSPASLRLEDTGIGIALSLAFQVDQQQYDVLMTRVLPIAIPLLLAAFGLVLGRLTSQLIVKHVPGSLRHKTPAWNPHWFRNGSAAGLATVLVLVGISPFSQSYFGLAKTNMVDGMTQTPRRPNAAQATRAVRSTRLAESGEQVATERVIAVQPTLTPLSTLAPQPTTAVASPLSPPPVTITATSSVASPTASTSLPGPTSVMATTTFTVSSPIGTAALLTPSPVSTTTTPTVSSPTSTTALLTPSPVSTTTPTVSSPTSPTALLTPSPVSTTTAPTVSSPTSPTALLTPSPVSTTTTPTVSSPTSPTALLTPSPVSTTTPTVSSPALSATPSPLPTTTPTPRPTGPSHVSVRHTDQGTLLVVDGHDTLINGMNYNVNYTQLPEEVRRARHHRDFQILRDAGVNSIVGWGVYDETTLEIAAEYGIGVIMPFDLDSQGAYEDKNHREEIKTAFREYVTRFKDFPAVWAWNPGGDELLHRMDTEQHRTVDKLRAAADFLVELSALAYELDPNHVSVIKEPRDWYVEPLDAAIIKMRADPSRPDPSRFLIYGVNIYGKPDDIRSALENARRNSEERMKIGFLIGEYGPFGLPRQNRADYYDQIAEIVYQISPMGGYVYVFGPDQPNPQAPNPYDPLRLLVNDFSLLDIDGHPIDGAFEVLEQRWLDRGTATPSPGPTVPARN